MGQSGNETFMEYLNVLNHLECISGFVISPRLSLPLSILQTQE